MVGPSAGARPSKRRGLQKEAVCYPLPGQLSTWDGRYRQFTWERYQFLSYDFGWHDRFGSSSGQLSG